MATTKKETTVTTTADDFKTAIAELGVQLCEEVKNGRANNKEGIIEKIAQLYTAIK